MFNSMHWTVAQADPAPREPAAENGQPITVEPGGPEGVPAQPEAPSPLPMILLLVGFMVLFWLLIAMPQRRERKRKDEMLSAMKKGDRVQTIGGILGTVVEIREHEVVVKVDESNNTRLHFAKAAVQAVLDKDNAKSAS